MKAKIVILSLVLSVLIASNLFALDKAEIENQIKQYEQHLQDSLVTTERLRGAIAALRNLLVQEEKAQAAEEKQAEETNKELKKEKD